MGVLDPGAASIRMESTRSHFDNGIGTVPGLDLNPVDPALHPVNPVPASA
jgi:hypothetical protein